MSEKIVFDSLFTGFSALSCEKLHTCYYFSWPIFTFKNNTSFWKQFYYINNKKWECLDGWVEKIK